MNPCLCKVLETVTIEVSISQSSHSWSCNSSSKLSGCRSIHASRNWQIVSKQVNKGIKCNSHLHQGYLVCEVDQDTPVLSQLPLSPGRSSAGIAMITCWSLCSDESSFHWHFSGTFAEPSPCVPSVCAASLWQIVTTEQYELQRFSELEIICSNDVWHHMFFLKMWPNVLKVAVMTEN